MLSNVWSDPISTKKDVIIQEVAFFDAQEINYKTSGDYVLIYR
jgi:hypothetical protein